MSTLQYGLPVSAVPFIDAGPNARRWPLWETDTDPRFVRGAPRVRHPSRTGPVVDGHLRRDVRDPFLAGCGKTCVDELAECGLLAKWGDLALP